MEALEPRIVLSGVPELIDLNAYGASSPSDFVQVGDIAFFVADDGVYGRELWKTDGTAAGTVLVKDIATGSTYQSYSGYVPNSSQPTELTEVGGTLFFIADDGVNGQELWKSDGTTAGTALVKDLQAGSTWDGNTYSYLPNSSDPQQLTEVNGQLFFSGDDGVNGRELWKTDGTSGGTVMVKDIAEGTYWDYDTYSYVPSSSDPADFVNINGMLFFSAYNFDDGSGRELWKSDGTSAGTVLVKDIFPGTYPYYYNGNFWADYPNDSYPTKLTAVGGTLFFVADDGANGQELWKSDGTSAGTVLVKDIYTGTTYQSGNGYVPNASSPQELIEVDGKLLFIANDGVHGEELWKSDGTSGGTALVKDIETGSAGYLSNYPGFTELDGTLFFSANDGVYGKELWKSDGTEAGTVLVKDIDTGIDTYDGQPNNSFPFHMGTVDSVLYFSAYTETYGRELWKSDGTAEGTVLVDDSVPGTDGLWPENITGVNGALVFTGDSDGFSSELWVLQPEGESTHDTARLTVSVNGQPVAIPGNVGVYSDGSTALAFTSDSTGEVSIDPASTVTLGDFFDTWRTNAGLAGDNPDAVLGADQLLDNLADATSTVQMFVNGYVSTEFGDYVIQDGDEIVLVYGDNPVVSLNTNFGPIVFELFQEETPITIDNFLNYVNDGDYVSTFFHRSVSGFVVQGGGFTTDYTTYYDTSYFYELPTDAPIANESLLSNTRGTLAMARTAELDSATSQFYVNLADNSSLDASYEGAYDGYTVFGQVFDMTTVDEIAAFPVDYSNPSPYGELPISTTNQLVVVQSVEGQGEITGVKFLDADADGVFDAGETTISGVTVYLDTNNNGVFDSGEVSTTTDANGQYLIQVAAGTYTVRADVSAGRFTTVPSGGSYAVTVEIGRENANTDFGEAAISAPTSVDLLAAADTGVADDDDLTNFNNASTATVLQFQVSGVLDGAEVRIFRDGVQIGAAVASGGVASVATDGTTSFADGAYSITATQVLNGGESSASTPLVITIDTVPPAAIASPAPDVAQAEQTYTFDADSPDEGQSGVTYSLGDEPTGMTIDSATGLVSWAPAAEQVVPQTFSIRVTDEAGNVTSQTVDLTVLGVIPAYPEEYSTDEDVPLTLDAASGVLANDGDENSGALSAAIVDQPANGSVTLNSDGSFTYTPNANFFGGDSFTYVASDQSDDSNVAKVAINVAGVNDPVTPLADSYTATEDTTLSIAAASGVLANDTDPDGDTLTATIGTQPVSGSVSLAADGSFTYAPNANFSGTDSFTYTVSDGTTVSDPVTVTINVTEVNDPPSTVIDSYSVNEDSVLTIAASSGVLANDSDPDSTLTAVLSTQPTNGSVNLNNDGSFTYTPNADYNGTDTFAYIASDGVSSSSATAVTVTVNNQADPPTATDDSFNAPNDGTVQAMDVLANDTSDPDPAQTLSIVSATQGTAGGIVTFNADSISYTAPVGFTGTDTFTYTIQDTDGLTDTATASVTVSEASSNSLSGYVYVDADGDGVRDADEMGVPGALITLTDTSTSGEAINRSMITLSSGLYTFDELPSGNYQLTERQPASLSDGIDSTTIPNATTGNDTISNIVLSGGQGFTENNFGEANLMSEYTSVVWRFASTSREQAFRETVAYAEEMAGDSSLAASIRDGGTDVPDEINSAPIALGDSYTVNENGVLSVSAASGVLANDTDVDGDLLTAAIVSNPSNGSVILASDGSFTYTPNADFAGTDSFTYQASDSQAMSSTTTVTITVTPVDSNDFTPVAYADEYSVSEDETLSIASSSSGVLANDTDADGDTLTAQSVSSPSNGTLTLNTDGSFTYTPNPDFSGTDSFTYQASDGTFSSSTTTVTITVNPMTDVPTATGESYAVGEDQTLSVTAANGVLTNDSDADGNTLSALLISSPANGTLALNTDGSFTYTPASDFNGTDSFTYQASDGTYSSNVVTVTIDVVQQNTFTVDENSAEGTVVGQLTPEGELGDTLIYEIDDPALADELKLAADDHLSGDPAAPVVLIEYLDFQCPPCQTQHTFVKELAQDLAGDLLVVRRHLPLTNIHANAFAAAIASEAAGRQGMFDEMADLLFTNQPEWETAADPTSLFETYATQLALDLDQFRDDTADPEIEARVTRDMDRATTLGVPGTPTFYLNGQQITNPTTDDDFADLIEAELDAQDDVLVIDRRTGEIIVPSSAVLDFETNPTHTLNVNVTNVDGVTESLFVTIHLNNQAEGEGEASSEDLSDQVFGEEDDWLSV